MTNDEKMRTNVRPLYEIAIDIRKHWTNVNYAANPYLNALGKLNNIHEKYFADDAKSIVLYFLVNAQTWRGEDARRIKKELNLMLKL